MKFLHLGDLHIGKRLNNISLLEDQRYILGQILDIAREERWMRCSLPGTSMTAPCRRLRL